MVHHSSWFSSVYSLQTVITEMQSSKIKRSWHWLIYGHLWDAGCRENLTCTGPSKLQCYFQISALEFVLQVNPEHIQYNLQAFCSICSLQESDVGHLTRPESYYVIMDQDFPFRFWPQEALNGVTQYMHTILWHLGVWSQRKGSTLSN